ncbi:proteasome subunit alpha type-3 [Drosophila persimilis]|nr:proteasome subunit alpha type-3 [Drosophila persimilis]
MSEDKDPGREMHSRFRFSLNADSYAPTDGRVYSLKSIHRCLQNSGTAVGIRSESSVVLAVENLTGNRYISPDTYPRLFVIDGHFGMAVHGLRGDVYALAENARFEASLVRRTSERGITMKELCDHLSKIVKLCFQHNAARPYAVSILLSGWELQHGPQLYKVEPSGAVVSHASCAIGVGEEKALALMEKYKFDAFDMEELVKMSGEIIYGIHDDGKGQTFLLETGIVGVQTQGHLDYNPMPWSEIAKKAGEEFKAKASAIAKENEQPSDTDTHNT